jgi:uncharacterized membrane protein
MNKRRSIIWIIAGGYLIYLGVSMFQSVSEEQPTNYMLLFAAAGFFALVGAILVFLGLRSVLSKPQEEEATDATKEAISESNEDSLGSNESNSESDSNEPEPKRVKTMRERAMIGNVITDDTQEVHTTSALRDSDQRRNDADVMQSIPLNPSLQNTDVDIASEDIIAATEEIIATQESEKAIATINRGGHKE